MFFKLKAAAVFCAAALTGMSVSTKEAAAFEPFIGEIRMVGFTFCPRGWAEADGQILPINQNTALFSLFGTIYGGDGRTTFALPDLRGRVAMHTGSGPGLTPRPLGARLGSERETLTTQQIPSHSHGASATLNGTNDAAFSPNPAGNMLADAGRTRVYGNGTRAAMAADSIDVTVGNTGGGQSHNNIQPSLVMRYCVALTGIFPSRN